jgi:hypothetical protein
MKSNLTRSPVTDGLDATGDLAMFSEMLADYGVDRFRRILRKTFAALELRFAVLRRVVARGGVGQGEALTGDVEECARQLQFMRIAGFDAGLRGFSEACWALERRARHGVTLAMEDAEALAEICREARGRIERLLCAWVAKSTLA